MAQRSMTHTSTDPINMWFQVLGPCNQHERTKKIINAIMKSYMVTLESWWPKYHSRQLILENTDNAIQLTCMDWYNFPPTKTCIRENAHWLAYWLWPNLWNIETNDDQHLLKRFKNLHKFILTQLGSLQAIWISVYHVSWEDPKGQHTTI